MRCTSCGTANSPTETNCAGCGQALPIACSDCGTLHRQSAFFCEACGSYLCTIPDAVQTPLADAASERKFATVLFVDVVGSTAAIVELDPEEAMAHMRPTLDVMHRVVEEFEGTVVRVTGDGLMALFGAPLALEGHALLACRAAIAIHAELALLPTRPRVRIGIHSGDLVAAKSTLRSLGDGAFGATLHLASRMEQLAAAGTTYLTAATYEMARSHFECTLAGTFAVKGFTVPIQVYELHGLGRAQLGGHAMASPSFAGRGAEMALLTKCLDKAWAGKARVAGIVASPGIGKSRLCHEFALLCGSRGVRVLTMRALAYGHATPYQPLRELLRTMMHVAAATPPERARQKVRRMLRALAPALEEHLDAVAGFLGIGDASAASVDPEMLQSKLLGIVHTLVRVPVSRPAVLIIEDLHWLDAASERFVRQLAAAATGTHTLVILNFRPVYDDAWLRGLRGTVIALSELGERATRAVTSELLGQDPRLAAIRDRIALRSGGNPLFIDALVHSLHERGLLTGKTGSFHVADATGSFELPSSIQSVLGERIDRLDEQDKAILQVASVIGLDFHLALLPQLTGRTQEQLAQSVARLQAAGLVEPLSWRDPVFAFKHPLIQEATYLAQLKARRSSLHAEVARALEAFYGNRADEFAGLLSHHYEAAGQPIVAAQYLVRAAMWIGKTDSAQALRYWKHACELVQGAPHSQALDSLRMLVNGQVVNYGWRVGMSQSEAKRHALEAQHYARESGDTMSLTLLKAAYGRIVGAAGSADHYVALVNEALDSIAGADDAGRTAMLKAQLSQAYRFAGRLSCALQANTEALRKVAKISKSDIQLMGFAPKPWIISIRGTILVEQGRFDRARKWLDRAIAMGISEPVVKFIAHLAYVRLAWFTHDAALAAVHASQVKSIADGSGIRYIQVYVQRCAGLAMMAAGDAEGAVIELTKGLRMARQINAARENEAPLLAEIAEAHGIAGRCDLAIATARRALSLARRRKSRIAECQALTVLAASMARHADIAVRTEAAGSFALAEQLATTTGSVAFANRIAQARQAVRSEVHEERELA